MTHTVANNSELTKTEGNNFGSLRIIGFRGGDLELTQHDLRYAENGVKGYSLEREMWYYLNEKENLSLAIKILHKSPLILWVEVNEHYYGTDRTDLRSFPLHRKVIQFLGSYTGVGKVTSLDGSVATFGVTVETQLGSNGMLYLDDKTSITFIANRYNLAFDEDMR